MPEYELRAALVRDRIDLAPTLTLQQRDRARRCAIDGIETQATRLRENGRQKPRPDAPSPLVGKNVARGCPRPHVRVSIDRCRLEDRNSYWRSAIVERHDAHGQIAGRIRECTEICRGITTTTRTVPTWPLGLELLGEEPAQVGPVSQRNHNSHLSSSRPIVLRDDACMLTRILLAGQPGLLHDLPVRVLSDYLPIKKLVMIATSNLEGLARP
jgi:hypothetical protein